MWGILPSTNEIIEITLRYQSIIIYQPSYNVYDSHFGTLSKNYSPRPGIRPKSRDYYTEKQENFTENNLFNMFGNG